MKKIILAGNAITAEILYEYLQDDPRYELVGLTVDDDYLDRGQLPGLQAAGMSRVREVFPPQSCSVVMAAGYSDLNRVRESIYQRLLALGYTVETYVHPDARVYTKHPIGSGSVVLPGAVIEPHVRVGDNAMVWCNVTLAHHSSIEDHCWIASGAVLSGQAIVKRNTFIGVNATIVNKLTVGEYNIIGAGALISKDTKSHTVHLARSAEPLRYSSQDYVQYFGV